MKTKPMQFWFKSKTKQKRSTVKAPGSQREAVVTRSFSLPWQGTGQLTQYVWMPEKRRRRAKEQVG